MRFIIAIVSFVLAVGCVALAVAQRTVFSGPDTLTATVETDSTATVTVVDGETLNALEGRQQLDIAGSSTIFAAYARSADVLGWIGDASYNRIAYDPESQQLTSELVGGSESSVPSPVGSDLWLQEYTGENALNLTVSLRPELSFIIVSDGAEPAPSEISLSWPLDTRTPLVGPFLAAAALLLLIAVVFLVLALLHVRRRRGPRRGAIKPPKTPRMPRLPRQRSYRVRKPKAITQARGRRSRRRLVAVVPTMLVGAVVLSGCSADLWPDLSSAATSASPSASPSVSASAAPEEELPSAVATVRQIQAIVSSVSEVATAADASLDATALASRFAGPALELRTSDYAMRAKDSAQVGVPAIPAGPIQVTLPQQTDEWPRTIVAVVQASADDSIAPVSLTMIQASAREQYKVYYAVSLEPAAVLPELAPEGVGATRLGPDSQLLALPPGQLIAAYIDVLNNGEASASYPLFDIEKDDLITTIGVDGRAARKAAIPAIASIDFSFAPGTSEVVAMLSNESGALVSAGLTEGVVVKPVEAGAKVNTAGQVKTLSGLTETTKGVEATYGDQLLFYIPPIGSEQKITLLGFSQGLIAAKELP